MRIKEFLFQASIIFLWSSAFFPGVYESNKVYASSEVKQGDASLEGEMNTESPSPSNQDIHTQEEEDFDFEEETFVTYKDPLEPLNKFVFGFNKVLDGLLIRPATLTYKNVVPPFARTGVHNFLSNLGEPVRFFNSLLQFEGQKAGRTLARFVLNTVFGLGGLFDVASNVGLPIHENDFGRTLSRWGFGEGFYLVLPVFGPSNFRDTIGIVGDFFMDPFNYYIYNTDRENLGYIRTGATIIDKRLSIMDITDTLDRTSDPYTTYRVTFTDNRRFVTGETDQPQNQVSLEEDSDED